MKIVLDHVEKVNYNVSTFWFKPEHKLEYTAGQFIEMYLPHNNPDERGIKHWFTLSSSPDDNLISITTKNFGDKASTFKKTLFALKPGTEIKIVEPMGDFVLPKDSSIPLVFVAGGIGLTPYHSIIQHLTTTKEKRQIQMLLAFKSAKDIIFEDLFKNYVANLQIVLSEPDGGWQGETGQLSADKILKLTGGHSKDKKYYISGPEPMVESLEKDMHAHKVPGSQLILDFFPNYEANLN